jgi:hypothetical protein
MDVTAQVDGQGDDYEYSESDPGKQGSLLRAREL